MCERDVFGILWQVSESRKSNAPVTPRTVSSPGRTPDGGHRGIARFNGRPGDSERRRSGASHAACERALNGHLRGRFEFERTERCILNGRRPPPLDAGLAVHLQEIRARFEASFAP